MAELYAKLLADTFENDGGYHDRLEKLLDIDLIRFLINNGVDICTPSGKGNYTPLMFALRWGSRASVNYPHL